MRVKFLSAKFLVVGAYCIIYWAESEVENEYACGRRCSMQRVKHVRWIAISGSTAFVYVLIMQRCKHFCFVAESEHVVVVHAEYGLGTHTLFFF